MRKIIFIEYSRQYLLTLSNRIYYFSQMRTHLKRQKKMNFTVVFLRRQVFSFAPKYFLESGLLRYPIFSSPKKRKRARHLRPVIL